ncbi:MAG: cupredoxin domain-containing protein [Patescibacteria group bacterium]
MSLDKLLVTLFSLAGIIFTYIFFIKKKGKAVEAFDSIDIIVDGGYSPNIISVQKGKPIKISFFRKDPSNCLEEITLPDFKIRKFLPLNEKTIIEINPEQVGQFDYSCGMNMFHGKIIVKE